MSSVILNGPHFLLSSLRDGLSVSYIVLVAQEDHIAYLELDVFSASIGLLGHTELSSVQVLPDKV